MNTWGLGRGDVFLLSYEEAQKKGCAPASLGDYGDTRRYCYLLRVWELIPQRGSPGPNEDAELKVLEISEGCTLTFLVTHPRFLKKGARFFNKTEKDWVYYKDDKGENQAKLIEKPVFVAEAYHRGLVTIFKDGVDHHIYCLIQDRELNDRELILQRKNQK